MSTSVLQYDEATQQCTITLRQSPWAGRVFSGSMRVCCQPTCGCGEIDFSVKPDPATALPDDQPEYHISLDTLESQVSTLPEGAMSPAELSLAAKVVAELRDQDWDDLHNLLVHAKRRAISKVDPVTLSLEAPFWFKLGASGMVAFTNVFPYGLLCQFRCNGARWTVEDLFDAVPERKHHQVLLAFRRHNEGADHKIAHQGVDPAAFYNYKTGRLGRGIHDGQPGQDTLETLLAAAKQHEEIFDQILEYRHMILRHLFWRVRRDRPGDLRVKRVGKKASRNSQKGRISTIDIVDCRRLLLYFDRHGKADPT